MLDKHKYKNEFYSLVGIKCYSYVPSLLFKSLKMKIPTQRFNAKPTNNGIIF